MAKSGNQKLKLMYLRDILLKNTDESHAITMSEIIKALEACGINAERKSLYDDFDAFVRSANEHLRLLDGQRR